jgi:hypothetical protein
MSSRDAALALLSGPPPGRGSTTQLSARSWVGRCRLRRVESHGESVRFRHLNLNYDNLLSSVAFNFNLRHYSWGCSSRC